MAIHSIKCDRCGEIHFVEHIFRVNLSFINNDGDMKTYVKELCEECAFMMRLIFEENKDDYKKEVC